MKNRMLSWVLALSLLLTMLPVSAMAAEDELAGDGLSVTESTQCTCGVEPDEAGTVTHADGCPLYEALACTCGAEPDEAGTVAHADGCPLYEAPLCTCGAEPDEAGAVTHADGCPLYEAPVCTCGAEPDETGAVTHTDGCPLYTEPVCTCGAEPDDTGAITHAEGCPLYTEPEAEEPQGLTPEQEAAMLAGLEDAPELLTLEDIPLEVQTFSDRLGMAFINGETHPGSYLVTEDNENNAGTGTPDDDLDRYLYRSTSVHPIEVNITIPDGKLPTQSCYIAVRTYDVNSSGQRYPIKAEYDILYVNDNPVGVLTGLDYDWNTSYYNVPLEYLKEGKNTIRVEIYNCPVYGNFTKVDFKNVENELNAGRLDTKSIWGVNIDWMQLVCDGGSGEDVEEYSLVLTGARMSGSSVVVDVSTEIVTTGGGPFVTEYSIVNEAGHIIGSYQGTGVTGSETFSITMPKDAPSGTYTIRGLLKNQDGVILATDQKDFQYESGRGPILQPTLEFTLNPDTLTSDDVTITAQVTDTHGCTDIEFLDSDTSAGDLCVARTVAANGTYTFTLSFTLDGEQKTQDYTVYVTNIDKEDPVIEVQPLTVLEGTPGSQVLAELKKAVSVTDNRGVDTITWPTEDTLTSLAQEPRDGKTVAITATDQAGNIATAQVTISVSPLPLELIIDKPVQNGEGFTLSATLAHTGGQTITQSGFVWGSMQNPTTTVYSGKAATDGAVGKGGSFTADTGAIDKGINYYVRAYVVAGGETYYSSQQTFDIGAPQYGVVSIQNNGDNTFTVSRTGGSEGAQTVYYRTVNGSAVGGVHFTADSGTVTIPAGQPSATITIQGENAAAVYQDNAATAYANADRTYQVEIYRVEGGATIQGGVSRAERTLTVDTAHQVDRNIFNEYQATTASGEVQRGDWDDDEIGWKLSQTGGSGAKETVSIAAILSGAPQEYYQAVMDHYAYQLSFQAKEDESGYQNIQIVEGDALDTSFGPKEDAWEGTWTTALYRAKFEHGGSKKNTEYAQYYFPDASGTNPAGCNLGESFRLDEFNANGAVVISKSAASISVGFSGSGDGSDKWKTTGLIHKLKVVDTQEPRLLGVAAPEGTYLPGDLVTISLIFDEIVDRQNSSLNSSTIINTSWGAFTYAGGADTNVLYFTGTVGSSGGTLTVTGISGGTIKDMAGNDGSSVSGGGNVDVDRNVPVVSIDSPTVAEDNSLLSALISATNATLLRYAWTASAAMPTVWQTASNTDGVTVSYRPEGAGPYWLHVQAFNSANGGSDYASRQFTLNEDEGGDPPVYVPPELTVAVDNNNPQWAKSRTITVERKPEGATVTYTGPGIAAPAPVIGNTVTATANGLYTFTLTSGEEKLVKSVQVTGIDTQAPAITLTTPGDTDLVYNSLTFGGTVSDDASGVSRVEYVFSTSSTAEGAADWQTAAGSNGRYTFAYTATQTEQTVIYLHARATDQAGNEKAIISQAYTVIKTPGESELPQITLTGAPTGWTKGPVTLTWTVTKPESGFTVQIEGGEASSSSTGTIQATRNGTYRVAVTDSNGNRAEASCEVAYIDTQPPVVGAVSVTPEGFAQEKTVSFAVSDTGSGVKTVEYRLGSGGYAAATADADGQYYFSVVADGSYEIRVTDQVGNSDIYSVQVRDIDTTGPTVTPGAIPEGWQMGDVTVSFTITDMESGVAEQQYIVTDSTSSPGSEAGWTNLPSNGQVTVTGNGQWYIHYKITDHAGNMTAGHTGTPVKIDNETPTITVIGGETGASELTLSVTASFGGSGGTVSVQKGGGEPQEVTGTSYTAKEAGTYIFKATSSAGKSTEKTVNVYGITFDSAGGSDVSKQLAASGGTVTEPVKPTKDGYAFDGWYKEANCTTPWNFNSDEVTGSITLYAKWTPAAYSITYHLDGGTASENPTSYTTETDTFTLNNPTRTGYTFAGWTGTGLVQATESVTIEKGSTGDRTYTATWTANTYTVSFDKNANDAAGEMTAQTFAYGQKQALTANAFTRTGYTFAGWNTASDGSGVKYSDQQEVENLSATDGATITLYAQWALEGLTVTITGAPEEPVTYGTEITLTAATTHTADGLTYTYQWYKGDAALPGKTESTLTLTDVADSGSYTVKVTASDGSQSSAVSSTPAEVEVRPLGITVTWSGLTRVYGDNESEVGAVLGGVLGNDACALSTITYQQGGTPGTAPTNAGEYVAKVSLTGADAANYTLKNGTAALTIRPKAVGFTVSNNAVEGDGTAKAATVIPTDSALTQTGYTVTYRQGTVTVAAPTAVGSYEIWVEITDGNYQHTNGKTEMQVGTLTITQAPPVLYDVTFAGGADVTGTMPGLEAVGNSILTLPECAYSRTDHKFTGWLYNGKVYQPGDGFTMPARNVTFTAQWQAVFTVDGIVTEETDGEDTEVKNAVVSLCLGANKISEVTTGADGKFRFENLIPGIYNLVVTKDVRTVTSKVELTESKTCDAVLPKGATNSIVEVTPGSPDIVVGKLNTVFDSVDEKVYTAEDEKTVLAGGKVEITFTAEEKQKTEVSEDLQKIQAVSDKSNLALAMDYRLDKAVFNPDGTLDTTASKAITQANVLLEILLPLPAELQGKAGYAVYRVHDGQAQELTMTPSAGLGEYFTVSSDKTSLTMYVKCFSTYAVGYTESSGGNGGGSSGGGTSTPVYPPSIEEPEHGSVTISPKNPEKGDQVTITPTPDEGYDVDTVVVTDSSGKEVAVTPNDDGTYTFVQPSGKVTITVTFRQLNSVSDCPRDESCPMAPFIDADRDAWYHDGVHYCVEHGLMMGTSQTTFAPDIVTTRGMIVTILWRLEGSPIVDASLDFDDVKAEDWYGEAVRWADSVGVVTGYGNGKFGPNDTITREQMAAMLWRYAGSPKVDGTLASFTDGAQTSSWAQSAMIWAVEQGLIAGVGNDQLEPTGQATRAQAATILMRFAQNMAQ